jgi:hypothetical protein
MVYSLGISLLICWSWGQIDWDFPFDFLPTASVGPFLDFVPFPRICKHFSQSNPGLSAGQNRHHLWLFSGSNWQGLKRDLFGMALG